VLEGKGLTWRVLAIKTCWTSTAGPSSCRDTGYTREPFRQAERPLYVAFVSPQRREDRVPMAGLVNGTGELVQRIFRTPQGWVSPTIPRHYPPPGRSIPPGLFGRTSVPRPPDRSLPLPKDWSRRVRSAAVHASALAGMVLTTARGQAKSDKPGSRRMERLSDCRGTCQSGAKATARYPHLSPVPKRCPPFGRKRVW
jgi:hypothetical protein